MFKLASLFVDIQADQSPFDRAMGGVHSQLTGANVAVGTFVGNMASMFARAAIGMGGDLFRGTIQSASSLAESISKTKVMFGSDAAAIIANAEDMSNAFGLPKKAMLDAADSFGKMGKEAKMSGPATAEFANSMINLAADAKSFYEVPLDVAIQKIQSGLSGESQPLRDFGVFLTEAGVAAEAMRLGLAKSASEMSEGAKIQARASLITKGLAEAQGDLARTSDSTANRMDAFTGRIANLGIEIGETVMPAFNALLGVGLGVVTDLAAGFEENRGVLAGWATSIVDAIADAMLIARNFGDIWEITTVRIGAGMFDLYSVFAAAGQNIVMVATYIGDNWYQLITDALEATAVGFMNFSINMGRMAQAAMDFLSNPSGGFNFEWKPLLEGFKATAGQFPELIRPELANVDAQISAIEDRMAGRELSRLAKPGGKEDMAGFEEFMAMGMAMVGGEDAAAGVGGKADKFKAESMDAADFGRKLRLAQGSGGTDEKQLTELQQIRELEQRNADSLAKMADGQFALLG